MNPEEPKNSKDPKNQEVCTMSYFQILIYSIQVILVKVIYEIMTAIGFVVILGMYLPVSLSVSSVLVMMVIAGIIQHLTIGNAFMKHKMILKKLKGEI
jgi:hypothetical protein